MRYISPKVFVVSLLALFLVACSQDETGILNNIQTLNTNNISDIKYYASKYPEAHYDELKEAADSIVCYAGKSVAIFGGSLASNAESNVCKSLYYDILNCSPIVTYGRGGLGYATENGSVQDFLPVLDSHDIYIYFGVLRMTMERMCPSVLLLTIQRLMDTTRSTQTLSVEA